MSHPADSSIRTGLAISLLALAACGGGGGGGGGGGFTVPTPLFSDIPPGFDSRATLFEDATAALDARSNTAFIGPDVIEGIPDSGEVDFLGLLYVNAATPGTATELYGQANLTANFGSQTMTGTLSDFFGVDRTGTEDAYSGSLAVTGGVIGKPALAQVNDFAFDYAGTLTGNGEDVTLEGTVDGKFKADPIRGLLGSDDAPSLEIEGVAYSNEVNLTAVRLP